MSPARVARLAKPCSSTAGLRDSLVGPVEQCLFFIFRERAAIQRNAQEVTQLVIKSRPYIMLPVGTQVRRVCPFSPEQLLKLSRNLSEAANLKSVCKYNGYV